MFALEARLESRPHPESCPSMEPLELQSRDRGQGLAGDAEGKACKMLLSSPDLLIQDMTEVCGSEKEGLCGRSLGTWGWLSPGGPCARQM